VVASEVDIKFSGWYVLAWWLFHNSIWVIDIVWKDAIDKSFREFMGSK
jgi:hypothetical protein